MFEFGEEYLTYHIPISATTVSFEFGASPDSAEDRRNHGNGLLFLRAKSNGDRQLVSRSDKMSVILYCSCVICFRVLLSFSPASRVGEDV